VPSTIDFNLTKDPDLAPFTKNFLWTFDEDPTDTTSTATALSRTYPKSGAYSVKLEIAVSNNCKYEIDKQDYIQLGDTVPINLLSGALNSCKNDIIDIYQANDTLTGSLSWTFSGLSHEISNITNDSASLKVLSSGNLDVVLDYTQNGCKTTKEFLSFISVQEVKARFSSPNRYSCSVPHTVNLINSSDYIRCQFTLV